jgi:hypothetical protein
METSDKQVLGIVTAAITAVMVTALVILCFRATGTHHRLNQPELDSSNIPLSH